MIVTVWNVRVTLDTRHNSTQIADSATDQFTVPVLTFDRLMYYFYMARSS